MDRRRIDELLERLLELPATERAAWLEREVTDAEERELLTRLLAASEGTAELGLAAELWRGVAGELRPRNLEPGTVLGAYRILHELGRGGMAVVYLAERADGEFEQLVALKILERPASDELAVRRFHLERQILASLEHPNIARLQDGGIAPDGRPYFVMERVDGLPIDRYCDEGELGLQQRLELFAVVGRAVAAAHRQLIVHRDLKPSNILVSRDGVPKLLDFGIAKLVEGEDGSSASPALTKTAMLVLTPDYASPEQLAGRPVTTASDVYQLGLLLYELLAGTRAFDFAGSTPSGLAERSPSREPTRPSAAVASTTRASAPGERARQRGCGSVGQLRKLLLGDLDTIVLAALHPEAERRYESVAALVADVERYLEGQPILARRPSVSYRLGKFASRHRFAVAAGAAVLAVAIGGIVLHTVRLTAERDRAAREAAKAKQVADFLVDVFRSPNARAGKKAVATTALEVAERGAAKITTELEAQPEVKASVLYTLGRVYSALLEFERAEALFDQAIEIQRRELGEDAADTLESLEEKAALYYLEGRDAESLAVMKQVIAGRETSLGENHPALARGLFQMSQLLVRMQRFDEALGAGERSLAIFERQKDADLDDLFRAHQAVAMALGNLGRYEESIPHHVRGIELLRQIDDLHPHLGTALSQYATLLSTTGRKDEARPLFAEAVAAMEAAHGADSPRTAVVLLQAAEGETAGGDAGKALALIDRALPVLEKTFPPEYPWVALGHAYRGYALAKLGRREEAIAELKRARPHLAARFGETSDDVQRCDEQLEALAAPRETPGGLQPAAPRV